MLDSDLSRMPLWLVGILYVGLQLLWTLFIRTFPTVLGSAFLKRLEHQQNLKLEKAKTESQAAYSTLKASVDYLSMTQPELRSKTIASVEPLWAAILEVKREFADVMTFETLFSPREINDALRVGGDNRILLFVAQYRDISFIMEKMRRVESFATETARLFVGDRLWLIFFIIRAVHGRFAFLVHKSLSAGQYIEWHQDDGVRSQFMAVLPKHVIDSATESQGQGLQGLVAHLEAEFLKEAARVMSGSQGFADSLADIQATLQIENQKINQRAK